VCRLDEVDDAHRDQRNTDHHQQDRQEALHGEDTNLVSERSEMSTAASRRRRPCPSGGIHATSRGTPAQSFGLLGRLLDEFEKLAVSDGIRSPAKGDVAEFPWGVRPSGWRKNAHEVRFSGHSSVTKGFLRSGLWRPRAAATSVSVRVRGPW
jgi:hypothetical protein